MQWELLLKLYAVAPDAPRLRHVFGWDGLPIDVIAAQVSGKQLWAVCLALREQLSLEGHKDQQLVPVFDTRQRHITRNGTGAFSNSQVHDGTVFGRLAL